MRRDLPLLLAAAPMLGACIMHPFDAAPATPQRPSYSSDTSTTAAGTFEVEAGVARNDEQGIDSPLALKYGAGSHTEVFAGISPYQRAADGTGYESGTSDVVLGARQRVSDGDGHSPSQAFQLALKLPSGEADALSSGETDIFGAWIVTGASADVSWNAYYQLGGLGDPDGGGLVVEHGLALAAGHPLGHDDLSSFGEIAAVLRPEWDERNVFTTLGLAFRPHPELVLDAFVVFGLSADAPDAAIGFGLTRNLGGAIPATNAPPR